MNQGRLMFWGVFLMGVGIAGIWFWNKTDPLHTNETLSANYVKYNLRMLQHPHPEVAAEAWEKLQHLFFTTWAAYFILQDHLEDPEPISFLLEKTSENVYTAELKETFKVARGGWTGGPKPLFYKADQRHCRTVGDALKAIFYNEPTWKTDFTGDWDFWWRQNQVYYRK